VPLVIDFVQRGERATAERRSRGARAALRDAAAGGGGELEEQSERVT
jgi:hypothetical protein